MLCMERLHHSQWPERVDAFLRRSKRCGFCPPDLPPFNELIEVQEDQLFSTVIHNPQHLYSTTSYHHLQLPLKATTSELNRSLPDGAGHLVDSNFISRIIFKDMYWTICHINQSVRLPIFKFAVINWSFTAVYYRYTYVNQVGHCYSRYYNIGFY